MTPPNPADLLASLVGTWRGAGSGRYPTIEAFEYDEELRFELGESYPLIHFEQRTTLKSGEPSHWESGFLRWLEDGTIQWSCAQDTGRVEVLSGVLVPHELGWTLDMESTVLGNDPRLVKTRRGAAARW